MGAGGSSIPLKWPVSHIIYWQTKKKLSEMFHPVLNLEVLTLGVNGVYSGDDGAIYNCLFVSYASSLGQLSLRCFCKITEAGFVFFVLWG